MDDKKAILVAGGVGGSDGSIGRCGGRKMMLQEEIPAKVSGLPCCVNLSR